MMQVIVPSALPMNRQLIVAAPDGTRVTIVVPPGLAPGQMMQIQLPNATPPAQQQALLEVMVPAGMSPGQRMRIQVPTTGQMMDVVIPPNVWPGMKMQVGAPAAPQRARRAFGHLLAPCNL